MISGGRPWVVMRHKGGELMNRISAPIGEALDRSFPPPFYHVRTQP